MSSPPTKKTVTASAPLLEAVEFDLAPAPAPARTRARGSGEACSRLLETAEYDASDQVTGGPATALRLSFHFAPDVEDDVCTREFVELLHTLDDFDRTLGGAGLALDASRCAASDGTMTLVLCPLDIRGSQERFRQMIGSTVKARV